MKSEVETIVAKRFAEETAEHVMEVCSDNGVYRHIRFQEPGTVMYHFDLVTWPGHLVIAGDCGDFMFTRIRDMFDFFDGPAINPHYWAEKLRPSSAIRGMSTRYSYDVLKQYVLEWYVSVSAQFELGRDDSVKLRQSLQELILDDPACLTSEHHAHQCLRDFVWRGNTIADTFEWELREYDSQFLWCCHAIVWGIKTYKDRHHVFPLEAS